MNNRIPKHIIEEHKKGVESLRFYGQPVVRLDRDGLLAFANVCAKELVEARQRHLGTLEMMRAFNRRA